MRKKFFTFLLALAASVGMSWALTPLPGDDWNDATKTLTVNSNPGQQAYQSITEIQHVVINNSVTSMGSEVFRYCTGLTSVTIPNSVTSIGYQVFNGCTNLTSVTIPNGITSIASSLFYNCSSLSEVTIPNSVTSIAASAFRGCSSLTSVTIPNNVTSIGMYAFKDCNGLTSVTIPNSVTSIEYWAFDGCDHVTDVYCYPLAADLTWNLANNSFKANKETQCHVFADQLSAYQDKFAAVNVTFVGDLPAQTLQVTEFEVPGSWYHDFTDLTASDFPGFVAASAAEAQAWSGAPKSGLSCLIYAFEDDEAKVCYFEDGNFPELGTRAERDDIYLRFDQGYQIYYTGTAPVYTLLTTITVQLNGWNTEVIYTDPDVATIATSCDVSAYQAYDPSISGYYVAWRANSPGSNNELLCVSAKEGYTITKVVFTHNNDASNKTTVYNAPFKYDLSYGNNNISKIEVYGEAETPAAPVVVASWESNSECNVVLTSDGKLTVSKLDYDGVMEDMNSYQSKKWRCFSDLITSVEIQEGVTHIGDYAFYNLQNVTSVSLPNSLTSIGDGAFMDCSITGDLVLPENVESIGEKCFSMVPKSLSTISIPASVTSIGKCAFENKGASDKTSTNVLTAINVAAANPNYCSVDGILYSKDMTTLIAYPAGKTNTEYEIPATVTEIKYNALYSCVNITDLTIPAATSVIEENGGSDIVAFSGCYGLENIHNNATTPQPIYRVLSYWEDQGQDQINLYVPSGLGATYEAAAGWQELNIIDSSTPAPATVNVATNQDPLSPSMHYSTFFHSTQNYALTGDGTQAFIAKINGGDFVLTKIADGTQVIPANTAVIFCKSGSSDPIVLSPTDEAGVSVNPDNNSLSGVDEATALSSLNISQDNCYVLSGTAEHGVGFYKINTTTLLAHKAYYAHVAAGAPPRRIRFVYSEANEATGVENVQGDNVQSTKVLEDGVIYIERNGVRYNAQGQIVK